MKEERQRKYIISLLVVSFSKRVNEKHPRIPQAHTSFESECPHILGEVDRERWIELNVCAMHETQDKKSSQYTSRPDWSTEILF